MSIKPSLILAILFATVITGCGVARGPRIDETVVGAIQPGITTEAQIRASFGEPVAIHIQPRTGTKVLTYHYHNDDDMKKTAATFGGMIIGGILGNQIGNGGGRAIATSVGAMTGGVLGENALTNREENQELKVVISLTTGKVLDYDYEQSKQRSQNWQLNPGVAPL